MRRIEDSLRDLWDNIKSTNTWIIGVPEEEEKKKGYEKIFEEIIGKFPQDGKGNSQSSPRGTKSQIQDKLTENHTKTHTNQTNKDQTQRKNIKSRKGEATSNIQGKPHTLCSWSFSRNSAGQKGMEGYILSTEKEKSTTMFTVQSKDLIQTWWRNQNIFRHAEVKRIQYHQYHQFYNKYKGIYKIRKYKRRNEIYKINHKQENGNRNI